MKVSFPSFSPMGAMAALLLLVTMLQLAVHGQAEAPPANTVSIEGFSYNGDGCPSGSAEGSISSDGQALTVMFSKYTATTEGRIQKQMRKSCVVTVKLNYPPGFVFTLGTVTMRGYGKLDAGIKGTIKTSYYISGLPGTASATHNFNGPFDDNYEVADEFIAAVESTCNVVRNLQLNSEVRVNPGKIPLPSNGLLTMDSQDLKLTQKFYFKWRRC
ncbi:hypothetical protein CBR_g68729 [Chara braunii]|uniref:DUF4360 domain-containing protein n=1 Tax=Chara braunii TaxID=69332 RepID=A0A388K9I8_CHABU|nr:hypothetical protein CBR_g68729 [Chara braunii]|eukprot:GBG66744.1 hypothetical protein CBR_g68729 [Chara braunii]